MSASNSARDISMSLGPSPARELAPPVVAVLITSAPMRTISRTFARMASGPLATPGGSAGSWSVGLAWPEALTWSPMPPVGEMMFSDTWSRGPGTRPSSTASRNPAASPPASRTVV